MVNTIRTLVKMDGSLCLKNDVVLLFSSYKIAIPSVLSYIADCEVCFVFSFILLISLLSFPNPFGFFERLLLRKYSQQIYCDWGAICETPCQLTRRVN